MTSRTITYDQERLHEKHTPLSKVHQPAHASTSRLRRRRSAGRTLAAMGDSRDGTKTLGSTPESKVNRFEDARAKQSSSRQMAPSVEDESFAIDFNGAENVPPTWLKRISTLSSLKSGSLEHSPRPGSPSIAYSNGSSAPFLPDQLGNNTTPSTRNKLVKRSTSQHVLNGSSPLHSTLRRPATSHQRSATLQLFQQDDPPGRSSFATSSVLPSENLELGQRHDEPPEIWQPFFVPRASKLERDTQQGRQIRGGLTTWSDSIKTVVPEATEIATLLRATSITSDPSNGIANGRASNISTLSRPFTSPGFKYEPDSGTGIHGSQGNEDTPELKSRNSFSLSEMFPSPSPTTWKMPRTSSVRRKKPYIRAAATRRVVSDPHSNVTHEKPRSEEGQIGLRGSSSDQHHQSNQHKPPESDTYLSDAQSGGSSSPLPPLGRLSVFEVDLPHTIPSYPTSPQPEEPASSPLEPSSPSPYPRTSSLGPLGSKPRTHRFSSVPSEPGSTLLGSDNDNSRLLSGDEDDFDSRSETVFDSTRTGATGNSHSGIRRPPIETIFDESPSPELPSKRKLAELQDLLQHDKSYLRPDRRDLPSSKEALEASTPIRPLTSCKDNDSPTPMRDTKENLLPSKSSPSSPSAHLEELPTEPLRDSQVNEDDEELWSFENAAISTADKVHMRRVSLSSGSNALLGPPHQSEPSTGLAREPSPGGKDSSTKSNIFEWSEQTTAEKDSTQGDSPRPKTVHGRHGKDMRGTNLNGRRGSSALHLRSQSVPVQKDMTGRRSHNNPTKLDSWVLGNKGPSEDWDGDFEFEEVPRTGKQTSNASDLMRPSLSTGMLVPRDILERQASFHGQFGQVKELTLLVEELKRLQQQAAALNIMEGQSAELWKEAEGIINLATLDDEEREIFPPRSPHSPSFEFDSFDEDSPSIRSRQRPAGSPPRDDRSLDKGDKPALHSTIKRSQGSPGLATPHSSRPRTESSAKAKSVLETIQRAPYDPSLLDTPLAQKKLPFDTTSLKDLVIRAGVVLRALKEIVRQASSPATPDQRPPSSRDPPFITQMFNHPQTSPTNRSPRIVQSPKSAKSSKSPKSQKSGSFIGGSITSNDNDINGHMKMMTVV